MCKKWLLTGENAKAVLVDNLLHRYADYEINSYFPYPKKSAYTKLTKADTVHGKDFQTFSGIAGLEKAFFSWLEIACESNLNDEVFLYDDLFFSLALQNHKSTHKYAVAVERLIQSGKKIVLVSNLQNDLYSSAEKMVVWLPVTMSQRVINYYVNEPATAMYKNALLISSDAALIGNAIDNDYEHGYYALVKSPHEIMIARQRAKAILKRATSSCKIYDSRKEIVEDTWHFVNELKKDEPVYVYLPTPPISTMDENLLKKILQRNCVSGDMAERVLNKHRREIEIKESFIQAHALDITVDYYDAQRWRKGPLYLSLDDRETNLLLPYEYDDYQQHISSTIAYAEQHKNIHLTVERLNFFKNLNLLYVPDKFAAAMSMKDAVDIGSSEPMVINALAKLLYIITPQNESAVLKNETEQDILYFYKKLIGD